MSDVDALLQEIVEALARPRRATYWLQLGPTLSFEDVGALAPYLSSLGVSEAYLSPCFRCGSGSSHGYDITDHNAFNPEIGTEATFDQMARTLATHGIGVILDVVPNHMGISGDANPWWLDVLENGPGSPYARFFDIDWAPVKPELRNKVLLPVLPDQYGRVLESQQLQLEFSEGAFFVRGTWADGRVKLYLIQRGLAVKRERPRLFETGAYRPLETGGARTEHLVAFARVGAGGAVVVAVPRLTARLTGFSGALPLGADAWGDTWLSLGSAGLAGRYRDRLTDVALDTDRRDGVPTLRASTVFAGFPVALLEQEAPTP